jgi:hypothetical protein
MADDGDENDALGDGGDGGLGFGFDAKPEQRTVEEIAEEALASVVHRHGCPLTVMGKKYGPCDCGVGDKTEESVFAAALRVERERADVLNAALTDVGRQVTTLREECSGLKGLMSGDLDKIAALRKENKPLAEFWRRCRNRWAESMTEVGPDEIQEWGFELGLLEETIYDPEKHGEIEADPGDTIYVDSELGRAILGKKP